MIHINRYIVISLLLSVASLSGYEDSDFALYTVTTLKKDFQKNENHKEVLSKCQLLERLFPQIYWTEDVQKILHQSTQQLQEYFTKQMLKAEELYEATLYADAILLYEEIIESIGEGNYPCNANISSEILTQAMCRIGQARYFLGEYELACLILEKNRGVHAKNPAHLQDLEMQSLYILALAYRNLGKYEEAIEILKVYLQDKDSARLPLYDEVQFELGLNNFLWGKLEIAKEYLSRLNNKSHKAQIYYLSQLYLGRIDLADGDYLNAEAKLKALSQLIPQEDVLHYELAYLRGEAAFYIQDYSKAAEYFEESLPQRNHEQAPWYPEALYQLGWSHLKMADDSSLDKEKQRFHFDKANEMFATLLKILSEEKVHLAVAQYHLARAKRLHETDEYELANTLLSKRELFQSPEANTHALLLRAEAAATFDARDKYYRELTQENNRDSQFYAKGTYLKGLNNYEHAVTLSQNSLQEAKTIFTQAATDLENAFELLKQTDKPTAALAVKYQIQALQLVNTHESQLKALQIIEKLIDKHGDILLSLKEPQEIFYLHGLIACHLAEKEGGEKFAEIAERTLWENISDSPNSPFSEGSLYLLGTLYMKRKQTDKAEETFLRLAKEYPSSQYADEALFWGAHCAEKIGRSSDIVKGYLRQIFEKSSNSQFAPAAYFQYHTYREYLNGDRASIKHLQAFKDKFPKNPRLINAYYLIGLDYKRDRKTPEGKWIRKKNLLEAIEAFNEAETTFDNLYEQHLIPEGEMSYYVMIRYRAILERALANLSIADESQGAKREIYLQYAEDVFTSLNKELADKNHKLASHLTKGDSFPRIQEESLYWLMQTYIKEKNEKGAQIVITEMLNKYDSLKISRGYFLSRIFYERGMFYIRREDYEMAWQLLMKAEDCDKGKYLSVDQKLDLWIQQSLCYKALNQMDKAMLILSKVINDDAISGLRLKAMYLRAEIYELQGRHELARKQLEATAKKGGEWAQKAKLKLDKEYGYQ